MKVIWLLVGLCFVAFSVMPFTVYSYSVAEYIFNKFVGILILSCGLFLVVGSVISLVA
jgi:hypothetical protein